MIRDIIKIDAGERIVMRVRKHWILLVRDAAGTIVLGVLPLIFIAIIHALGLIPPTVTIPASFVSFLVSLWFLVVWMALVVIWTNYYLDTWIITNKRIFNIEQVTLFNRRVATWSMERIQEITVTAENPLQVLLEYGTIQIQTAGPTAEYALMEGVPHPNRVRTIILKEMGRPEKPAI